MQGESNAENRMQGIQCMKSNAVSPVHGIQLSPMLDNLIQGIQFKGSNKIY